MPIYGFECKKCGWRKDELQSVPGDLAIKCENCGELAYRAVSGGQAYGIKGDNSASTRPKGKGQID